MKGIIISKNANLFTIESGGQIFNVYPSGKTKSSGIFVGDYVEFDKSINKVYNRKNFLIRPPLANLDNLFIVISPVPKPDLLLVDKILLYCEFNNINPILVVNKYDLDEKLYEKIYDIYGNYFKILKVCAKTKDVKEIEECISGICALAGQSASGKSSIINAIFNDNNLTNVGDLSKKIERGKQTTRIVKLYKLLNGYIADTAGFSLLDLSMVSDIDFRQLSSFYPDFLEGRKLCKYRSCIHDNDENCGVKKLVNIGKISRERYNNYLKILNELKLNKKY